MRVCQISGCESKHYAKGYCSLHYQRYWMHGSPDVCLMAAKGSGTVSSNGYLHIGVNGTKRGAHVLVAERAIKRKLKRPEEVHHVDENKLNNSGSNLVICPNRTYHKLLHIRTRALDACGNPDYRKCSYCGQYDDPSKMYKHPYKISMWHRKCQSQRAYL